VLTWTTGLDAGLYVDVTSPKIVDKALKLKAIKAGAGDRGKQNLQMKD
jgi:hypothetical protein